MLRPVIVGVVGGGREPIPIRASELARHVGAEVVHKGGIVLTGGTGGTAAVKDAAADGANAGCRISIVKSSEHERGVSFATGTHLVVKSGMLDARNVLNGFGSDALIVLWGGAGTLTEVAFAALARKPIVFIESQVDHLKNINGMKRIATEAAATFGDNQYAEPNLLAAVVPVLQDLANDARSVEDAVGRALKAPRTASFPAIHGQLAFATEYEAAIEKLGRACTKLTGY